MTAGAVLQHRGGDNGREAFRAGSVARDRARGVGPPVGRRQLGQPVAYAESLVGDTGYRIERGARVGRPVRALAGGCQRLPSCCPVGEAMRQLDHTGRRSPVRTARVRRGRPGSRHGSRRRRFPAADAATRSPAWSASPRQRPGVRSSRSSRRYAPGHRAGRATLRRRSGRCHVGVAPADRHTRRSSGAPAGRRRGGSGPRRPSEHGSRASRHAPARCRASGHMPRRDSRPESYVHGSRSGGLEVKQLHQATYFRGQ